MHETAEPGGNGESQVYFEGAFEILRNVKILDLTLLYGGKLALADLPRVRRIIRRDGIMLPPFANDIKKYRKRLIKVARENLIEMLPEPRQRPRRELTATGR